MSDLPPPPSWRDRLDLLAAGSVAPSAPQIAGAVAAVVVVAVLGWVLLRQPPGPPAEEAMTPVGAAATTSTTEPPTVLAHAAGAVRVPGVYSLPPGARVADLLDAAGGATGDADLDRVNLAAPVADGAQVYVPREGEPMPVTAGGSLSVTGPLDLNTATQAQLEELPGVGPATAKAILDERERRGRFGAVEELLEVRGIGPAKLDALRDLVTV